MQIYSQNVNWIISEKEYRKKEKKLQSETKIR